MNDACEFFAALEFVAIVVLAIKLAKRGGTIDWLRAVSVADNAALNNEREKNASLKAVLVIVTDERDGLSTKLCSMTHREIGLKAQIKELKRRLEVAGDEVEVEL